MLAINQNVRFEYNGKLRVGRVKNIKGGPQGRVIVVELSNDPESRFKSFVESKMSGLRFI